MESPQKTRVSFEEFLRLEEKSDVKHEFRDGELVAMAGGSYAHSLVIANIIRELGNSFKGKPCRVLDSNMRVLNHRRRQTVYPDATIVCGPAEHPLGGRDRTTIVNPRVVVEVISPSSEGYDQKEKFDLYREIDSVEEYVLIWTTEARVSTFRRMGDGQWKTQWAIGLDQVMTVGCLGVEIPLKEIYANVEFGESE